MIHLLLAFFFFMSVLTGNLQFFIYERTIYSKNQKEVYVLGNGLIEQLKSLVISFFSPVPETDIWYVTDLYLQASETA